MGNTQPANAGASTPILGSNPTELAASMADTVARIAGAPRLKIWLVPNDPSYSVPAASWTAQSGDILLFDGKVLPEATRRPLERRAGQAHMTW